MNAAVIHSFDAPPTYTTFAEPVAREGELPVSVTAVGLHPIVKVLAAGTHYASSGELPAIAGIDGVGRLEDGRRVYFGMARSPFGTFAERTLASPMFCVPLPDALEDTVAAGITNPGMSSWMALTARAKFVAGESVLILGATGAAGQLAVQIAKQQGARRVIAAGRNPVALAKLTELGADRVISLEQEPEALAEEFREACAESGLDVVLDYVWGTPAESLLNALSQKGMQRKAPRVRFVQIGDGAGKIIAFPAAALRSSGLEMLGSGFGSASLEQIKAALGEFLAIATKQPFHLDLKAVPLSEVESWWNASGLGARLVFVP